MVKEKFNLPQRITYVGPSMKPTFFSPDELQVLPYNNAKDIKQGDVVAFSSPGYNKVIVHRVVAVNHGGIRVRGDNNKEEDRLLLKPADIIGRVVKIKRGNKMIPVFNGTSGRFYGVAIRWYNSTCKYLAFSPRFLYHLLAGIGLFKTILPRFFKPRIVLYNKNTGETEFQAFISRVLIARYVPARNKVLVRSPFKLFLDEKYIRDIFIKSEKLAAASQARS